MSAPVYSHLSYDIVPDERVVVSRPDILIIEGLNVLQPARPRADGTTGLAVSDFFDFSVYVDADTTDIRRWYVNRFLSLRDTAFRDPRSYFTRYAELDPTPPFGRPRRCGTPSTARTWSPTSCPPGAGPPPSCARTATTGSSGSGSARSDWPVESWFERRSAALRL